MQAVATMSSRASSSNDVALLGSGDQRLHLEPSDGSDTVDGQAGFDTLVFAGSSANKKFDVSPNRATRPAIPGDVGNVTMDLNGVEHL